MRKLFAIAAVAAAAASPAGAAECNLARAVEDAIAGLADRDPVVTFIAPIAEGSGNLLDDAIAATVRADNYFLFIQRSAGSECLGMDGISAGLDNPVQWQAARKNVRAASGIESN